MRHFQTWFGGKCGTDLARRGPPITVHNVMSDLAFRKPEWKTEPLHCLSRYIELVRFAHQNILPAADSHLKISCNGVPYA